MSRCFPYPPPGYVKIGARGCEGSVESIKLQKESNKTDRRKEKKRQREEKELLKKQVDANDGKIKKLGVEKSQCSGKTHASACLANLSDDSTRSGVTEEQGGPVPENHFYLSDGADGSKKRKLDAASPSTAESGKKIRIRFTIKRKSNPEAPIGQEPSCSTSTPKDADPLTQLQGGTTNTRVQETSCSVKQKLTTTERKDDVPVKSKKEEPIIESMYQALVEDWAPPIFTEREEPYDQDWLFGTQRQEMHTSCRLESETGIDASRPTENGDLWPRARYLPGAEIFALPYTVPF